MEDPREEYETRREFRYALMRLARSPGYLIFYFGILLVFVAILFGLTILPAVLQDIFTLGKYPAKGGLIIPGLGIYSQFLAASIVAALGFGAIALGPAMYIPYQIMTRMPTTYTRKCHCCGKPIDGPWLLTRCPVCGAWFPIGVKAYLVRLFSKLVTVINWTVILLGVVFFMR